MFKQISLSEKVYIEEGIALGIREDGRDLIDNRTIHIENCILPHSNGSSRVKLNDCFDIICSIKMEVIETITLQGLVDISVDYSPSCNLKIDDKRFQEIGIVVSKALYSTYVDSQAIDLNKLSIIPNKYAWSVMIDLLILQAEGDALDACSIATYVALKCTKYPKFDVLIGESGKFEDFEISGEFSESLQLSVDELPVIITIHKIGDSLCLDCTANEIQCSDASLSIAVDRNGDIYHICKGLTGAMTTDLTPVLSLAISTASDIINKIDNFFSINNPIFHNDNIYLDEPPIRLGLLA